MAEQSRSTEPWTALVVVAALVAGGGLFFGKPFESSRHKETHIADLSGGTVPARLWQDPYTAIMRCMQNKEGGGDEIHCASGDLKTPLEPQETDGPQELVIMPVMVYGDAYSESVEKRRRRRYAVLSAMFMQDYRPDNAQTIAYFMYTPTPPQEDSYVVPFEWLRPNTAHYQTNGDRPPILLLWLDERRFGKRPLTRLGELLRYVEKKIALSRQSINVTLLGPAGSTVLREMVHEASDMMAPNEAGDSEIHNMIKVFKKWRLAIFSPVATASAKLILGEKEADIGNQLGYKNRECCKIEPCLYNCRYDCIDKCIYNDGKYTSIFLIERILLKAGIQFFRTITSDKELLRAVIDKEFKNRNIDSNYSKDVVVLISEWDTFYGRSLPEAFISHIRKKRDKDRNGTCQNQNESDGNLKKTEEPCPCGVCHYVYMRGLDGEILDNKPSENGTTGKKRDSELERAVGVSRFDYLRRLAHQIKNDFYGRSKTVRAVGVLGSDVYDLLLVLQALRPSFPNALFFTTDADARYLHPAEFKWTRGLVVLSGYGLTFDQESLPEPLASHLIRKPELELPPFRDSYQTSMFVATRLAMSHSLCELRFKNLWCGQRDKLRQNLVAIATPKTFEVGRSMLIPLGENEQKSAGWKFRPSLAITLRSIVVASGILIFCLFLSTHYSRRQAQRIGIMAAFTVSIPLLVTAVVFLADGPDGEPFPLRGSANTLPTLALLVLTLIMGLFFLTEAHINLRLNGRWLVREFRLTGEDWAEHLLPHGVHTRHERLSRRWLRHRLIVVWQAIAPRRYYLCGLAGLHVIFSIALISTFGDFSPPIRGMVTFHAYHIVAVATLSGFFMLVYFFVEEAQRCRKLAFRLTRRRLNWRAPALDTIVQQKNITTFNANTADGVWDGLASWGGVRLLAERTQALEKSVYYPFVVLLLLIVTHNGFFDNWRFFVPSIIIVLLTGALVIAACVVFLRLAKEKVRESALASIRVVLDQHLRQGDESNVQRWRMMIEEVENERRGAFRPIVSDPIFKALLMPLGGYGSLYLIDYLTRFLQG